MKHWIPVAIVLLCTIACQPKKVVVEKKAADSVVLKKGTFAYDLDFLKRSEGVMVLGGSSPARIAIIKDFQGRVMTSTAGGDEGSSYGWINYALLEKDSLLEHFNPFGGEDRIWLGPEGGQYSVFFTKGSPFDFQHWQTPTVVDTQPFDLVNSDSTQATFHKSAVVTNYSGFTFEIDITRQIRLWTNADIEREFGISLQGLKAVAFESSNTLKNAGTENWTKKNGLLSLWILGMMTPSDHTTLILPYEKSADYAKKVTDDYFGEIPADRLVESESLLLLKADGKFRGKVGISPTIAKDIAGSYDADRHILTLVKFDLDPKAGYVNSKWEIQKNPYAGDAVNAYNDGPLTTGGQLGPFYELESSSPAKELKAGESITHRHRTLHLEGDEAALSGIAMKTLGVALADLPKAFANH